MKDLRDLVDDCPNVIPLYFAGVVDSGGWAAPGSKRCRGVLRLFSCFLALSAMVEEQNIRRKNTEVISF